MRSPLAQTYTGTRFLADSSEVFDAVWAFGDRSVLALTHIFTPSSPWKDDSAGKGTGERAVLQLLLAKLMEPGQNHKYRSLIALAHLLASDSATLSSLIDQEYFDAIVLCLDTRVPEMSREQATSACASYLRATGERGQQQFAQFVISRVANATNEDLIYAFSAASAIFPIVPSIAATLFLAEGFVESLVPLMSRRSTDEDTHIAALEMLSAACIDNACRGAVTKHCVPWLREALKGSSQKKALLAGVTLAKIKGVNWRANQKPEEKSLLQSLVKEFMAALEPENEGGELDIKYRIEGLAYTSLVPYIKDDITSDKKFLLKLIKVIRTGSKQSSRTFGGLSILEHLTAYIPPLSEEQKRLSQLKAYANASKSFEPDALELNDAVDRRCSYIFSAGTVSLLVDIYKDLSPTSRRLALTIMLSLAKTQKFRGEIAQQGGIKLAIATYTLLTVDQPASSETMKDVRLAAHVLARILVSVDPNLYFGGTNAPAVYPAITMLITLLTDNESDSEYTDYLPTYEALLSLTNLASLSPGIRDHIAAKLLGPEKPILDDFALSHIVAISRSAVELTCNLAASPAAELAFGSGLPDAARRLTILVAQVDSPDMKTRSAAGATLSQLAPYGNVRDAILDRKRALALVVELACEEAAALAERGLVCLINILEPAGSPKDPSGDVMKKRLREEKAVERLTEMKNRGGADYAVLMELVTACLELLCP